MGRFILNLPDDKLDALRGLSQATGTPIAHFVRQGIDWVLGQQIPCCIVMSGGLFVSGQMSIEVNNG